MLGKSPFKYHRFPLEIILYAAPASIGTRTKLTFAWAAKAALSDIKTIRTIKTG